MSEHEQKEREPHAAIMLLPWYLNGTLTEEEHRQVEQHLTDCETCRTELEGLRQLREEVRSANEAQPGPSPDLFQRVMARIELEKESAPHTPAPAQPMSERRMTERVQALFAPRWVPVLASALIVVQLGVIVGLLGVRPRERHSSLETLSGPVEQERTARGQVALLRVAFREQAPEQEIRALLQSLGGRIVDGPTAAGFYQIEVRLSTRDAGAPEKALQLFRSRPDIIRFVEPVAR